MKKKQFLPTGRKINGNDILNSYYKMLLSLAIMLLSGGLMSINIIFSSWPLWLRLITMIIPGYLLSRAFIKYDEIVRKLN